MSGFADAATLLLRAVSHFALTIIPGLATAALVARWRPVNRFWVGSAGLAGMALPSYIAFWLWFLSPPVGHAFSFLLPLAGLGCLYWAFRKLKHAGRQLLKELLFPCGLVLSISLIILSAGFLYGGMDKPLSVPWQRFSHRLPPDNILPYVLAEEVRIGQIQKHFLENWHSSDRPPLQAAIVLSQYPFLPRPRQLGYTAAGVILQSFWIFGVWLLLSAFDLPRRLVTLILFVTTFSGFIFVNSFFVWPKLLAAAFMTPVAAVILVDELWAQLQSSLLMSLITGSLVSFGMLAHGGSAFALIGGFVAAAVLKRRLPLKPLLILFVSAFLLYLPWLLYQKLFDPPGDYLLKIHLAGMEHPDDRPLWNAIRSAYGSISFNDFVEAKKANFLFVFDYLSEYWGDVSRLTVASLQGDIETAAIEANRIRMLSFFHFTANLGVLSTGLIAFAAGSWRRQCLQGWMASARLWLFVIWTLIPWCFIMFRGNSTSIHQGTYVAVLLAVAACLLALWAIAPWLCIAFAALQIAINFWVYGVYIQSPQAGGPQLPGVLTYGELTLFLLAAGSMTGILWYGYCRKSPSGQPSPLADAIRSRY